MTILMYHLSNFMVKVSARKLGCHVNGDGGSIFYEKACIYKFDNGLDITTFYPVILSTDFILKFIV